MLNSGGSVNAHIEASKPLSFEFPGFEKVTCLDLGHPLLNRIAESFVKAAGIGAVQVVSREAYFTATEASGLGSSNGTPPDISGHKKNRLPDLRGGNISKSLEAMVKHTGKELQKHYFQYVLQIFFMEYFRVLKLRMIKSYHSKKLGASFIIKL